MLRKGPAGLTENKDSKQVRALGMQILGGRALQEEGTAEQRPGGRIIPGVSNDSKVTRVQGWVNQKERSRGNPWGPGHVRPRRPQKDFGFALSDVVESSEQRRDMI